MSPETSKPAAMRTGRIHKEPRSASQTLSLRERLAHALLPANSLAPVNPALLKHAEQRRRHAQDRVADGITGFSGSMLFVYIHIIWFGCWIALGVEKYPYGLLTMIVSLEAIFLSTFVLISQNRAAAKHQVVADQQWETVQEEHQQNVELLHLSRQILSLTKEVRAYADTVEDEKRKITELLTLTRQLAPTEQARAFAGPNAEPSSSDRDTPDGHGSSSGART